MFDGLIDAVKDFIPKLIALVVALLVAQLIYSLVVDGGFDINALVHILAVTVAASLLTVLTVASLDNAK